MPFSQIRICSAEMTARKDGHFLFLQNTVGKNGMIRKNDAKGLHLACKSDPLTSKGNMGCQLCFLVIPNHRWLNVEKLRELEIRDYGNKQHLDIYVTGGGASEKFQNGEMPEW